MDIFPIQIEIVHSDCLLPFYFPYSFANNTFTDADFLQCTSYQDAHISLERSE